MNKTLINFLQQNRVEKFVEKRGRERRYHQVQLPMTRYHRKSSLVNRNNATIWPIHRMMRAAMMKKMMVPPAKFP